MACTSEPLVSYTTADLTQTSSGEGSSSTDLDGSTDTETTTGDGTGDGLEPADGVTTDDRECRGRKIYVALEGRTLTTGPEDDAPNDVTVFSWPEVISTLDYDGDGQAFVDALQALFEPFAVCVTAERPADGPYDMVVFATNGPLSDDFRSLAMHDCLDENPSNLVFVFIHEPGSDDVRAKSAAFSLGTTMGLNAQDTNPNDIMHQGGDLAHEHREWLDVCIPVSNGHCMTSDECEAGEQNSYRHMMATLGPAE